MPLVKAKDAKANTLQPEVLRLQDIEAEAARILTQARAAADSLLAQARAYAEKIKAEAYKAGMEAGRVDGIQSGTEMGRKLAMDQATIDFAGKHADVVKAFTSALCDFQAQRRTLCAEMERDVVALAGAIARRVVKTAVEVDPSCVCANIREALQLISEKNGLEIRLAPTDLEQARQFAGEYLSTQDLERVRFVADETVEGGGALLRTPGGEIDAALQTQFVRILDEILAGWQQHWMLASTVASNDPKEASAS